MAHAHKAWAFSLKDNMRTIHVFPDYCSTGLWENHVNMDESYFTEALDPTDFIALKYWHNVWEFNVNDGTPGNDTDKLRPSYWRQWGKDGKAMVDSWNAKQSIFHFVYQGG